jgi:hypothetical protein
MGVSAEINVGLLTNALGEGTPPINTVAPETKFVPVIDTGVEPDVDPDVGVIADTIGAVFAAHGLAT